MPRYDYQCDTCEAIEEHSFSMADKPESLSCSDKECGGRSTSLIGRGTQFIVRGNERPMNLDATCLPIGFEKGNTGPEQQARYSKIINEKRKLAKLNDKEAIKGGIRHIGSVPRELDRLRKRQYGKDYYQENTKQRLAEDGLLFTDN